MWGLQKVISVIMCVKTGAQYFPEAYQSLLRQEHVDWELLIGVNGLPAEGEVFKSIQSILDKTGDHGPFHRGDKQATLVDLPDFTTKPQTANYLARLARGSHLAVLDVDDIWHPWKLAMQLPHLRDNDVVGAMGEYFGTVSGRIGIKGGQISFDDLIRQNEILHSSVVISKRYAKWPETDKLDDYPLWLYLAKHGVNIYNVTGDPLVRIRQHADQHFPHVDNSAEIREYYQGKRDSF